jgi:hypothetical protein
LIFGVKQASLLQIRMSTSCSVSSACRGPTRPTR